MGFRMSRRFREVRVREIEPNVVATSALCIPSSGIFEPTSLLRQVYFLASNQGVKFMTGTEVVKLALVKNRPRIQIRYRDGSTDWIEPKKIVNAAGVNGVDLARMMDSDFPLKAALIQRGFHEVQSEIEKRSVSERDKHLPDAQNCEDSVWSSTDRWSSSYSYI